MNTDLFHRLHHRGWELSKRTSLEVEWLKLMADTNVPDHRAALTDFMAQRNANVMHHRTRKVKINAPILHREMLIGSPYWVLNNQSNTRLKEDVQ